MNALDEAKVQEITEILNRLHKLHKEQHQLTALYRTVCSCGWVSREYGNGDMFNESCDRHLQHVVEEGVAQVKRMQGKQNEIGGLKMTHKHFCPGHQRDYLCNGSGCDWKPVYSCPRCAEIDQRKRERRELRLSQTKRIGRPPKSRE